APEVQDADVPVEALDVGAGTAFETDLAVRVVFDDGEAEADRQLHQAPPPFFGQGDPGRVLKVGHHVAELGPGAGPPVPGPVLKEPLFQEAHLQPVAVRGNGLKRRLVVAAGGNAPYVAGLFDDDRVAGV